MNHIKADVQVSEFLRSPGPSMGPRLAELISHAFGTPIEQCVAWINGPSGGGLGEGGDWRALTQDGSPNACLRYISMGQYFGGRSVPMVGIAGVAVAPEHRGQGLARSMMQSAMRELAERRVALSALYASTQSLYRQVGYEQAGYRCQTTIPMESIDVRERLAPGRRWIQIRKEQQPRLVECATRFAKRFDGMLDRGPYCWGRIWEWRSRIANVFALVDHAEHVHAFVSLAQNYSSPPAYQLEVADVAFSDASGARAILGFIHDYASMAREVKLLGPPAHPLLHLLAQQRFVVDYRELWMLRLVDLERALTSRGYSASIRGQINLHVLDPLLPANHGVFVFSVTDGQCVMTRQSGTPSDPLGEHGVRLSINALASIYSGLRSPEELTLLGLVEGSPSALVRLGGMLPAGTPWTPDFF